MRTLRLDIEQLTELTADDLSAAAGGLVLTGTETMTCPTIPLGKCVAVPAGITNTTSALCPTIYQYTCGPCAQP